MKIDLDSLNARVVSATDDERAWLHQFLSFEDQSSKFTRRRDGTVKVGASKRVSLLRLDDTFPAGLVGKMKRAALQTGKIVGVVDKRKRPCTVLTWQQATGAADPWLYDFQQEAVDAAITRTRGILDVPTGGGKTEIAVGLAMRLGMTNTLFIAPEADLMHNAARRWEKRTGIEAGRIGDGWMDPRDGFTAATFQTLAKRMDKDAKLRAYLDTVGAMTIDEVHTLPADSFYRVAQSVPAYWRIGVSGTPLARGDRRSLFSIAATGSIIYRVSTQLLIDRGFISRPHIRMVTHLQSGSAATWQKGEKENIVESKSRNALVTRLAQAAPKPGLVFVRLKKHGRELTDLLRAAGLRVEFVWGEKKTSQRDAAVERLRNGDLDVIVCSVVFQTGTDIPEVRSMVIACGGKSEIATLQRIGRGMRIVKDASGSTIKDEFYVFDVMDIEPKKDAGHTGNRWNARHSRERFKAYTGVGHEVTIREGI
jgi:superfamily II DNA or RNA helicase